MGETDRTKERRQYRWAQEARELVRSYRNTQLSSSNSGTRDAGLKQLVSRLVAITGHPRRACWYFVRQMGLTATQEYRKWTMAEQQRLLDLMGLNPLREVAKILRRSERSLRSKLHKLGASSQMGRDWFTKYTLAEALHVRAEEVQRWLDRGWLKGRTVETGGLRKEIIDADAFAEFCKGHRNAIVGRRLNTERLDFIQNFVFPPSHAALLPVRERGYKKRNKEQETGNGANPSGAQVSLRKPAGVAGDNPAQVLEDDRIA